MNEEDEMEKAAVMAFLTAALNAASEATRAI